MKPVLALDIYGTLIDPLAVGEALQPLVEGNAADFAEVWRAKQLEYSFRRALMGDYVPFSVVTADALDFTCAKFSVGLSEGKKTGLLNLYRALPAFDDVEPALAKLKTAGVSLHAFSNGVSVDIELLLDGAGIRSLISSIVSVEAVQSFKPDPKVYRHFSDATGSAADQIYLVSSNPFDVAGAMKSGWKTIWVCRDQNAVFDPWVDAPTHTVSSLTELSDLPL